MGLFDFLKPKKNFKHTSFRECDIDKTEIIAGLFNTPKENRDEQWKELFFENVKEASFASENQQVITGPDGFPYFILKLPEENTPFDSFCIRNIKDIILESGTGITVRNKDNTEWVFSYGDIVNLHLRDEFYSKTEGIDIQNKEVLTEDEEVLIAQPSEEYLPWVNRNNIKKYLKSIGVETPGMILVCRKKNSSIIMELAFNLFQEDFETTEELNQQLHRLSWFLPSHYIILSVSRSNEFEFVDL